jgi:DNA-binding PadR family transcriptional regulator
VNEAGTAAGEDVPPRLGTTSYLVLGLLASHGPRTPYELKAEVSGGIGYFWAFPHSQLYLEPPRLVSLGLAQEEREDSGRRRRRFRITDAGRDAVARWVAEPVEEHTQIRDLALLKLFFGGLVPPGTIAGLARGREAAHRERLAVYEQIEATLGPAGPAARHEYATVRLGLAYERSAIEFWAGVAVEWDGGSPTVR